MSEAYRQEWGLVRALSCPPTDGGTHAAEPERPTLRRAADPVHGGAVWAAGGAEWLRCALGVLRLSPEWSRRIRYECGLVLGTRIAWSREWGVPAGARRLFFVGTSPVFGLPVPAWRFVALLDERARGDR
jgi:hypothetical protein